MKDRKEDSEFSQNQIKATVLTHPTPAGHDVDSVASVSLKALLFGEIQNTLCQNTGTGNGRW
jgi:hypothetical protein